MKPIIKVRGVSKRYRVRQGKTYGSLRESLATAFKAPLGLLNSRDGTADRGAESHFLALRRC